MMTPNKREWTFLRSECSFNWFTAVLSLPSCTFYTQRTVSTSLEIIIS